MAAWLVARGGSPAEGFTQALWIATGVLAVGALLYLLLWRVYPVRR
jgi:hypothetical protein